MRVFYCPEDRDRLVEVLTKEPSYDLCGEGRTLDGKLFVRVLWARKKPDIVAIWGLT